MKRFLQISGMALFIMLFADMRNNADAQPTGDVSYQTFYDELSPYGRWIDYPDYGYVWCPDEGADFRPYNTNGHWVWSDDYEWMWVSDYSWGWAPFHYGRWFYDDIYGWMWMPGYEWSPAWVAWRSGGDYYGWAPLRPGINISYGFSIGSYAPPVNYWCFTPCRYITSPRIYDYCVGYRDNITIINNTTIINNYNYSRNVFVTGPRRFEAERYTHERINPVRVRDMSAPGRTNFRNNEVSIYRPAVSRDNNRGFAPRSIDTYRGNQAFNRNDNRTDRRSVLNDRNNNTGFNNRNAGRREIFNNDRVNRNEDSRRPLDARNGNPNQERRNTIETPARDNNNRERPVRDVFGRDNRPGIDQPVQRNRFERQDRPAPNNGNFNRQDARVENNERRFPGNNARQEQQNGFDNRNINQQPQRRSFPEANRAEQQRQAMPDMNRGQQQRPSVPEMNRVQQQRQPMPDMNRGQQRQSFPDINRSQQQPRQFAQPNRDGNGNDNNRGGFNHGRRN